MIAKRRGRALLGALVILAGACGGGGTEPVSPPIEPVPPPPPTTPLRQIVASRKLHVAIGTAVGDYFGRTDASGQLYAAVLAREFGVVTPENELKFASLRPSRAAFSYARPDSMLAFAKANGMQMRGHTLVFGSQLSPWLTNGAWTAAEGRALLDEHVSNVVSHYKGQLAAWDVVNEALSDDGTLKPNFWANLIGRSYIEQAFRTAAAADPAVPLFYNDYNIETAGAKSDSLLAMLQDFRARGVPITGVGFQAHFEVGSAPSRAALAANLARFAALGLRIHVTELDVRIVLPATPALLQAQAQVYSDVVQACLDTPNCDMLVTWGFTDLSSWVPSTFAGRGAALLFDAAFQPKPAYTSVNDLLTHY